MKPSVCHRQHLAVSWLGTRSCGYHLQVGADVWLAPLGAHSHLTEKANTFFPLQPVPAGP